jgi:hypothetical protein
MSAAPEPSTSLIGPVESYAATMLTSRIRDAQIPTVGQAEAFRRAMLAA